MFFLLFSSNKTCGAVRAQMQPLYTQILPQKYPQNHFCSIFKSICAAMNRFDQKQTILLPQNLQNCIHLAQELFSFSSDLQATDVSPAVVSLFSGSITLDKLKLIFENVEFISYLTILEENLKSLKIYNDKNFMAVRLGDSSECRKFILPKSLTEPMEIELVQKSVKILNKYFLIKTYPNEAEREQGKVRYNCFIRALSSAIVSFQIGEDFKGFYSEGGPAFFLNREAIISMETKAFHRFGVRILSGEPILKDLMMDLSGNKEIKTFLGFHFEELKGDVSKKPMGIQCKEFAQALSISFLDCFSIILQRFESPSFKTTLFIKNIEKIFDGCMAATCYNNLTNLLFPALAEVTSEFSTGGKLCHVLNDYRAKASNLFKELGKIVDDPRHQEKLALFCEKCKLLEIEMSDSEFFQLLPKAPLTMFEARKFLTENKENLNAFYQKIEVSLLQKFKELQSDIEHISIGEVSIDDFTEILFWRFYILQTKEYPLIPPSIALKYGHQQAEASE